MAVTEAYFNSVMAEAAAACRLRDFATTRARLEEAEIVNAGLPVLAEIIGGDGVHVRRRETLDRTWKMLSVAEAEYALRQNTSRFVRTRTNFG